MFRTATIGYARIDRHGTIHEINDAGARMLGVPRAETVRRPLTASVVAEDRPLFRAFLRHLRHATEPVLEEELTFEVPGGGAVRLHLEAHCLSDGGDQTCWIALTDVTEQQRLAEERHRAHLERQDAEVERARARSRSEAQGTFFAAVSHELRTPLTPVLVAATVLGQLQELPEDARQLVATICRNVELESRLIDDLLDVTRIARDKLHLERLTLDLHELLQESVSLCRLEADVKHITIAFHRGATDAHVAGDPTRLRQVFWNLLKNAFKYTPDGGHVAVTTSNTDDAHIRVAIVDDGIGIDPQALPALFRPFEQLSPRASDRGLGLGLAITKGIIDAHGGRLQAASAGLGHGSTFEVELATIQTPAPQARPTANPRPVAHAPLKVLIVEDHADSAEMLARLLASVGHVVEIVPSVAGAIAVVDAPWDAVITDLGLPDGSGFDVCRAFRSHTPRPRLLLALSGYGTATDTDQSRAAGFDEHLVKPVEVRRLLEILGTLAPAP